MKSYDNSCNSEVYPAVPPPLYNALMMASLAQGFGISMEICGHLAVIGNLDQLVYYVEMRELRRLIFLLEHLYLHFFLDLVNRSE